MIRTVRCGELEVPDSVTFHHGIALENRNPSIPP